MSKKIFTQEMEGTKRRGRPRKGWREEVERDLQVLGVRRWREMVTERTKSRDIFRHCQSPQRVVAPMEEEEEWMEEWGPNIATETNGSFFTNLTTKNLHFYKHVSSSIQQTQHCILTWLQNQHLRYFSCICVNS